MMLSLRPFGLRLRGRVRRKLLNGVGIGYRFNLNGILGRNGRVLNRARKWPRKGVREWGLGVRGGLT